MNNEKEICLRIIDEYKKREIEEKDYGKYERNKKIIHHKKEIILRIERILFSQK